MIGVYGANGFIGRHVVRRFVDSKRKVRAVSRHFDQGFRGTYANSAEFVEAELMSDISMSSSLQDVDVVVQLISSSSPAMGNRFLIEDIEENVIPHVSFIKSAIDAGVKKFIFVSSGGTVYGENAPVPTPESAHLNPINSHGMTKVIIEKYLQMFGRSDGLNYQILRVSNPFGPGQTFRKGQGLIPAVLQRHREGQAVQIFGDGQSRRDYIFIDDLIDAIEAIVNGLGAEQEIYNIGKGESRTVIEVLEAIESTMGIELAKEFVPGRRTDVGVSTLDISKARKNLGWSPDTPFIEGVRRMCASEFGT